jgi:hypothetical protein
MPERESGMPPRRFLLRASVLLAAMLLLWWLTLVNPLLAVLRLGADLPLRCLPGATRDAAVRVLPTGDWSFRVSVPSSLLNPSTGSQAPRYRGIQLELPQSSLVRFTLAFPVFWALVLCDPDGRRVWRSLGLGTAAIAAISLMQVFVFVGYTIETTLHLIRSGFAVWLLDYVNYMNSWLITYTVPFCVALWIHRRLRADVLTWDPRALAPEAPLPEPSGKPRRSSVKGRNG